MDSFALVRSEHLNHHGYLFGGCMLKWVDEYAWLAASREYHGCRLVTVGMDKIVFREPVANGSILRFDVRREKQGTTSVTYTVDVFADAPGAAEEKHVFATQVTFVCVDAQGRKQPLPCREALNAP
jgi:acyl-CoA hydrolase